jgi:lipopolysaccharide export system permease protein
MTLFSRYIFRQATGALLMILASLTAIVWIAIAMRELNVMTTSGQSSSVFLRITLLIMPDIIAIIAPIALLIAALYTLNRMNSDSELIVMTAAGAPLWRFARPLAVLAIGVTGWLIMSNFLVMPWSQQKLNDVINQVRTDLIAQVLQPGQFISPEEGLTFHIRERDNSGRLLGLVLDDRRSKPDRMTYLATSGEIIKREDKAYLVLNNGTIVRKTKGQDNAIIEFEHYVLDLASVSEQGHGEGPKPHARYLSELLHPDPLDASYKANPGTYRAELHDRFATLLYPIVFVAIAVAFVGQARTNRQSRTQAQVTAFVAGVGVRLLGVMAQNMASAAPLAVVLMYGMPLVGGVLALLAAQSAMRPRRPNAAMRAANSAWISTVEAGSRLWPQMRQTGQGRAP